MSEQVIAEIRKNNHEIIRVTLKEHNGVMLCNIRIWYRDEDGDLRPGRGVAFKRELLPAVADGVNAALRAVEVAG